MAKEMEVSCDFIGKQLVCTLPNQIMDVLLKVRTKTGEHTFREDVYMHSLKYRMWNNQLRPFRSLKKRVANIFRKRTSNSDDSRGTSSQSIVNYMERDSEERSMINESKRNSVHSDWTDLIPIDVEAEHHRIHNIRKEPYTKSCASPIPSTAPVTNAVPVAPSSPAETHKAVKNIVLLLYTPKLNEWGSWQVKDSQFASSAAGNSNSVPDEQQEEEEGEVYQLQSPYYSLEHPPEFYGDE